MKLLFLGFGGFFFLVDVIKIENKVLNEFFLFYLSFVPRWLQLGLINNFEKEMSRSARKWHITLISHKYQDCPQMVLIDTFGYDELQAEAAWKEGISLQHLDKTAT